MPNQILEEDSTKLKPSQWSDLPIELSEKIIYNLCFSQQVRFRAVCKRWRAAQHKKRATDLLPWLIKLPQPQNNCFKFQLCELSNPTPITVQKLLLPQVRSQFYLDVDITYGYGWLLFSISREDYSCTNFILFSILTKEVDTLPPLPHKKGSQFDLVKAFSAEPSSPNCVFIVLKHDYTGTDTISTLQYGRNKYWTLSNICKQRFRSLCSAPLFIRGNFYFVSPKGGVASYNIASGKFKGVADDYADRLRRQRVFELNGDLMLAYINDNADLCCIQRFAFSAKIWEDVTSLGGSALFVSDNSMYVSTVGEFEEEAKKNGIFANSIYWLTRAGCCIVFSLNNYGRFAKSTDAPTIAKWDIDGDEKSCLWFKPPEPESST